MSITLVSEVFLEDSPRQRERAMKRRKRVAKRRVRGGRPQVGGLTCCVSPHQSCKHVQIKMRDYLDRRATPCHLSRLPHLPGVPPPPCKQALKGLKQSHLRFFPQLVASTSDILPILFLLLFKFKLKKKKKDKRLWSIFFFC